MLLLWCLLLEDECEEETKDHSDRRTDILKLGDEREPENCLNLPVSAQYVFGLTELEANLPQSVSPQHLKPQDASWQTRRIWAVLYKVLEKVARFLLDPQPLNPSSSIWRFSAQSLIITPSSLHYCPRNPCQRCAKTFRCCCASNGLIAG